MTRLTSILDTDPPTAELVDAATCDQMEQRAETLIPHAVLAEELGVRPR